MVVAYATLNGHSNAKKKNNMSRMKQDLIDSQHGVKETFATKENIDTTMLRRALANSRKPHVCIVGAGFAGLRCADILLRQGVKVTIYEARDRVGGRVGISSISGTHTLITTSPSYTKRRLEAISLICS